MKIALSLQTLPERYLGVPQRSPTEPAESTLVQSTDMHSQWASLSPVIYVTDCFYLKMLPNSPKTQKQESILPARSKSFESSPVMKNLAQIPALILKVPREVATWPHVLHTDPSVQTELGVSPWGVRFHEPSAQNAPATASFLHPVPLTPGCTSESPGRLLKKHYF